MNRAEQRLNRHSYSRREAVKPIFTDESTATMVFFVIDSYVEADDYGNPGYAICTPTWRICGSSIPDTDENGKIHVYDQAMRCLFDEEAGALVGRRGWAVRAKPIGDEAVELGDEDQYDPYDDGSAPCRWVVGDLCCPEN